MYKEVHPEHVIGNGLVNPFTNKKGFDVCCGNCHLEWYEKVRVTENLRVLCPGCGAVNTWSFSRFMAQYDREILGK